MRLFMILIAVFISGCASKVPVVEFYRPPVVVCDSRVESALKEFSAGARKYERPSFEVWIRTLECLSQNRLRLSHTDES